MPLRAIAQGLDCSHTGVRRACRGYRRRASHGRVTDKERQRIIAERKKKLEQQFDELLAQPLDKGAEHKSACAEFWMPWPARGGNCQESFFDTGTLPAVPRCPGGFSRGFWRIKPGLRSPRSAIPRTKGIRRSKSLTPRSAAGPGCGADFSQPGPEAAFGAGGYAGDH